MVELDGTKMSKSLGNLVFVSELVKAWDPMAVRLAILDHSYRAPWAWHEGLLPVATDRLARWRAAGAGDAALDAVRTPSTTTSTSPGPSRPSTGPPPPASA